MNPTAPQKAPGAAPEALDPTIVNLAKAIRETETRGQKDPYTARGGSGEFGAYQYTKGTWDADAKQFLGRAVPLEKADKVTQNEVAYKKLKSLKDKGYNVGQIASIWNSGKPEWEGNVGVNKHGVKYDVPQYVNSVSRSYQALKAGQVPDYEDTASTVGNQKIVAPSMLADEQGSRETGAWFPSAQGDNPIIAGLKAAGNVLPSAFNLAKGTIDMALHPIESIKAIASNPLETLVPTAVRKGVSGIAGMVTGDRIGTAADLEEAQRYAVNDPFATGAFLTVAGRGAAKLADRTTAAVAKSRMPAYVENIAENTAKGVPIPRGTSLAPALDAGLAKVADVTTAPARYAFGKVSGAASGLSRGLVAKASGLNPETITQVAERPKAFTPEAMSTMTRKSLGEEVASKLAERKTAVSEAGKEYAPIRAKATKVKVAPNYIDKTIAETTGLKVTKGKLSPTGKSSIRDGGDIRALQQVYDLWKPEFAKGFLTAEEYLNFRADLGKMAGYGRELTKSKPLQNLADIMRGKFNTAYRGKLDGLEALDKKFGPMTSEYRTLSKDFIDAKTGELKDAAINRIANASGKGKDALLARLEEVSPGITLKIRTLKAIEDIQNIHKVGTYTKSLVEGGGLVGGIATGNIALIVGSIVAMLLTQPEMAVRMIRGYGNSKAIAGAVLDKVKEVGGKAAAIPGVSTAGQVSVFGRPQQVQFPEAVQ